jgi:hypothetical protein
MGKNVCPLVGFEPRKFCAGKSLHSSLSPFTGHFSQVVRNCLPLYYGQPQIASDLRLIQSFMKNTLLFLGCLLFTLNACKSDGNAPQKTAGSTVISMKINGVDWKAEKKITGSLGVLKEKQFVLGGTSTPGNKEQDFTINLEDVTGPGTYTTSANAIYNIVQYAETDSNGGIAMYKSQKDGLFTVNITRCNGLVTEGTFSGSIPPMLGTSETIIITEGKFQTQ